MQQLKRELGLFGAVMMGLGSIIGTGIFVSVGIAAGIAGSGVLLAIVIAALVATFNGLSSAQLAANHPVSGGTYEYGYHYLNPQLGFVAGWAFLLAKSASAATAALGFAGYLLNALNVTNAGLLVPLALVALVLLTLVVIGGMRRSSQVNTIIVSVTLAALLLFVLTGIGSVQAANFQPFLPQGGLQDVLHAAALMFVAYTGYGRIATLGEEVRQPRRTIPRAIILTLVVTALLYVAVAAVGVGTIGADALGAAAQNAAPLEAAASSFAGPLVARIVAVGAITAMLGVLLNLLLGLSRVLLAMGRRRDMPPVTARLNAAGTTPVVAVPVIAVLIGGLVLTGNVKTTWSFSAFTVLIYYGLTNLAALRLSPQERLVGPWTAWLGLVACFFLAFWVEPAIWGIGLLLLAAGLVWQFAARRLLRAPVAGDDG